MEIENKPIGELIEYSFNNRIHSGTQVDRIANSIEEFGFNQPIVIDENNVILVGHGRFAAAKKLCLKTVPVIKVGALSEAQKRAYRILDNKLQNDSEWHFDNLKIEMDLIAQAEYPIERWGLEDLAELYQTEEPVVHEDEPVEPISGRELFVQAGDLIELGAAHRLLCGDSTDSATIAALMQGRKADMMFTDPPYGVAYAGGHFHSGDVNLKREREALANDEDATIYPRFLKAVLPFIDGPCYTWFAGTKGLDVYKAVHEQNCEIHAIIIWHKTNAKYAAMNAQYKQRHEPCLYFKPKKSTLRWCGPSDECTVWEEKRDGVNNYHPTQKPVVLPFRALKNHEAALVLDPFLGSGSTLIAADQLGRTCYGLEISPAYCQVIIERYLREKERNNQEFDCRINGELVSIEYILSKSKLD